MLRPYGLVFMMLLRGRMQYAPTNVAYRYRLITARLVSIEPAASRRMR